MSDNEHPLTNGWEQNTPVEDTMLRRFLFNWSDDIRGYAEQYDSRVLRCAEFSATDLGRPVGIMNCAILLQPPDSVTWSDVLAALDTFYDAEGATGMVILVSAWPTPDLRPARWNLMGHPPLHLRPAGGRLPDPPAGLQIKLVTDVAGLAAFEAVLVEGFPAGDIQTHEIGTFFDEKFLSDPRRHLYVGWEGDRPVSIASAFIDQGIVDVDLVATIPDARRRGYAEAVTWRATLADPSLPAMLLSSDMGRPIYERMGFLPLHRFTFWYRERPGDDAA